MVVDFDAAKAVAHLRTEDDGLAALIDRVGPFELELRPGVDVFGMLAEAIVFQQLSTKAAATIFGRLCALFGSAERCPLPTQVLAAEEDELRGVGLSRAKVAALRDLAVRTDDGTLPPLAELATRTDDEIVAALTRVRGIGPWSAQMFLIFRLGRPDVLPLDDFGLRRGYQLAYRLAETPGKDVLAARGERWRPYRTVASWYLWKALDEPGM